MRKILIGGRTLHRRFTADRPGEKFPGSHANVSKRIRDPPDTPGHAWEAFD